MKQIWRNAEGKNSACASVHLELMIPQLYGGFLKWGHPSSWMVYSRRFATRPPARMVMVPGSDEVGPMLGPYDTLLGLSWAHMTQYLVTDPFSPPYEILAIFKNHGKTLYMTLYWASLGPLFNVYLPMLGPCWPYITPCRAHLGSIGRYVRTMLGLCWTQNTP